MWALPYLSLSVNEQLFHVAYLCVNADERWCNVILCFSRRLLSGVSGSYAQRRPLRSQKDVRQQRPGPKCLQEGDHYHGESSITVFEMLSPNSTEVFLPVCVARALFEKVSSHISLDLHKY